MSQLKDFAYSALNTTLGVWATREQYKISGGTALGPGLQGAVTGTPQNDGMVVRQDVKKRAWYQRPEVLIGGVLLAGLGGYALLRGKR